MLGLTFRKDLYLASSQVMSAFFSSTNVTLACVDDYYREIQLSSVQLPAQIFPPLENDLTTKRPLTRLQERLIKKLGGK